jgi:hypothetical protein
MGRDRARLASSTRIKRILMTYRLVFCLMITSVSLAAPRSVAADPTTLSVYDTVDAVELKDHSPCSGCGSRALVIVTGIRAGSSGPSSQSFDFNTNVASATRCEHLAVIAMSKPGKYQFSIGTDVSVGGLGDCKLNLVTP